MASESEIDRLVIRLIGDATQYLDMLNESVKATKDATKDMKKAFKGIEAVRPGSKEAAAMDVANQMAADRNKILAMREAGQKRKKEQQEIDQAVGKAMDRDRKMRNKLALEEDKAVGSALNRDRKMRNKLALQEDQDVNAAVGKAVARDLKMRNRLALQADRDAEKQATDRRQQLLNAQMAVDASVRKQSDRDRRMGNRLALQADKDADRDRQKMLDDTLRRQKRHSDQVRTHQLRDMNERSRLREQEATRMRELNEQTMMTTVGGMGAAISGGIFAGGAAAVDEFRKFNQALTESVSIMSLTREEEKKVEKAALDLGAKAVHGPAELAKAFYFMASAGLSAEQSIAALPAIQKFAVAGNFDLAAATTYASDAQAAMGLKAQNAAKNMQNLVRITDVLVKADTLANATVLQFSRALTRQAGGSLKAFNKDVEEGVAVLAAMADQGVKAQLAGTHLSMILRHLNKNAVVHESAFRRYGISVFDAAGKMRNFADIIEDFEEAFEPMSDQMKAQTMLQLGFDARMQQSILPLIGTSKAIRKYEQELRKAGGTTERVADRQMESFNNQILIMWNLLKAVGIEIGGELAPTLLVLSDGLKTVLQFWRDLDPAVKSATVAITVSIGAFTALGTAIFVAGLAFNKMFGGIGLIVGLLVTGAAAATGALAGIGLVAAKNSGAVDSMGRSMSGLWKTLEPVRLALGSLGKAIFDIGKVMFQDMSRMEGLSFISNFFKGLLGDTFTMKDAMYQVAMSILSVEFALFNLDKIWKTLSVGSQLAMETMEQELIHLFMVTIPGTTGVALDALLKSSVRFSDNIFNVFKNIGENIVAFFTKLPDIISGKISITKIFKSVKMEDLFSSEDWKNVIIPPRVMTETERKLAAELEGMIGILGDDYNQFIQKKIDELFGGKIKPKVQSEEEKQQEEREKKRHDALNKEIRRFDAAVFGSAEAIMRITEYRDRLFGGEGGTFKSRDASDRSKIKPATNLPSVLPAFQGKGAKRVALEGGGGMMGNDKLVAGLLKEIADNTGKLTKKKGADIDVTDLA